MREPKKKDSENYKVGPGLYDPKITFSKINSITYTIKPEHP